MCVYFQMTVAAIFLSWSISEAAYSGESITKPDHILLPFDIPDNPKHILHDIHPFMENTEINEKDIPLFFRNPALLQNINHYFFAQYAYLHHVVGYCSLQRPTSEDEYKAQRHFAATNEVLLRVFALTTSEYHDPINTFLNAHLAKDFLLASPEAPYHGYIVIRPAETPETATKWDVHTGGRLTLLATPAEYGKDGKYSYYIDRIGNVLVRDLGQTVRSWGEFLPYLPDGGEQFAEWDFSKPAKPRKWVFVEPEAFAELEALIAENPALSRFVATCGKHTTYANWNRHHPLPCGTHFYCDIHVSETDHFLVPECLGSFYKVHAEKKEGCDHYRCVECEHDTPAPDTQPDAE